MHFKFTDSQMPAKRQIERKATDVTAIPALFGNLSTVTARTHDTLLLFPNVLAFPLPALWNAEPLLQFDLH